VSEEAEAPSYLVCLGASAGGLEALEAFFSSLPPNTDAAYIIVSHLSPDFKSLMPELLSRRTQMEVRTAADNLVPAKNTILIIPPGKNMVFQGGRLRLEAQDRTGAHVLQLPIDIFLRSVAKERAHRSIAIILSGTGSDGSRGIRALKDAGGMVLAQQPDTARFDGMPRSAVDTGVVDAAASPVQLASYVVDIIRNGALSDMGEEDDDGGSAEMLAVLEAMRAQLHIDLTYLRPSMLRRRVRRRMALLSIGTIAEYAERLVSDGAEARALNQDTLIGVTGFFRDPDAFKFLQKHLATNILRRGSEEQFRVWVPACASGEEVYSLAMLVHEAMEVNGLTRDIKIFATDVDEDSLARASKGVYPATCIEEIGAARASKYFVSTENSIAAKSFLREMVIFAQHNLVRDPPFTRIDLVSCRNFLIYLTPTAQENVLGSLHFSLVRGGTLFLGSAEALGRLSDEFDTVDSRFKVFTKSRNVVLPTMRVRAGGQDPVLPQARPIPVSTRDRERDAPNRQILELLIESEQRSIAVLTPDGALSDIIGDPVGIFRVPKGKITSDVARLLVEPLVVAVTTGLQRLRRGEEEVQFAVELEDTQPARMTTRLTRVPAIGNGQERILLVVEPVSTTQSENVVDQSTLDKDASLRMKELQNELMQTRESLQSTIEELQSANEEQQSTNEELVASNEELQSTNEELQSVNEELFTVNVEYQNKIQELAVVAADLNNLLRNINIGILFLDADLRIRKFTPAIDQVVKLVEHDVGRSIEHFAHSLGPEFAGDARRVLESGQPIEREARSAPGSWLLVRIIPYLTHSGHASGVVATFFDVTPIKNAHEMTRVVNKQLAHVNSELSTQREELEEMFSIVAHDLKRPVLALDGLLSLIRGDSALEERVNGGEGEEPKLLKRAIVECTRMRQMLVDLESISGIQNREIESERVEAQRWLDELIARFAEPAKDKGVRVNCTCDAGTIQLATGFVHEAVVNIMENALKYGCTDPTPRIDVAGRILRDTLEISIADNGKGISPENHQKIFEPFRRLDPDAAPGSGVGLLAVKRLVHRVGGSITLESKEGQGAKFTLRVPLSEDSVPDEGSSENRVRVLLVEDDLLDARSVERCLRSTHAVTRVQDLGEAESRLEQQVFDVILLDLSLPDGHGFELLHRMNTVLKIYTPIVVITGHGEGLAPADMDAAIGAYLSKSDLEPAKLLAAIDRAMKSSSPRTVAS
jgi:two-component system CheB/CheR fusion protein